MVCNIQRTSRPVPTRLLVSFSNRSSGARATIAKASSASGRFQPLYYPLQRSPKTRWRRIARSKRTRHRSHRALTKELQSREKQRLTAHLRGSGPLRLAAATRCGLRLARQSSAAPTEGRIGGPRIQSPPFRSGRPALERNRVYPGAMSRGSSTGQDGQKLLCRVSRPVFGPPEEAQPPNHCTAAGLKEWGGGTRRGTGGCAQPEVGRGATAARDLSSAQC